MTGKGGRYRLTLRALPEEGAAPDPIRLRHALKCLLRSWGLRCELIEALPEGTPADDGLSQRLEERR